MIIDRNENKWYKVGLHIHTTLSDGKMSPKDVIALYESKGYDAIALTDHWHYSQGGQFGNMLVLSGCEYNAPEHDATVGVMHIVGVGMERQPQLTVEMSRQQVVEQILACGGLPVLAHPAWSMNTLTDAQDLPEIVHTEVYNAVSEAHESMRAYSESFVDMCANAGIYYGLLATDDTHYFDGSDECKGWVMVRAEELSRQALLKALRAGDYYASQGPELYVTRQENRFIVECSPCIYVTALSNLSWTNGRTVRGQNITQFTYECRQEEKWLRIQCCDQQGNQAWSNVFKL